MTKTLHGFAAACYPDAGCFSKTFSYGVFPLVRTKDGQRWKRGKVLVRVVGNVAQADRVKAEAKRICDLLDAGAYTGPKRVVVPLYVSLPVRGGAAPYPARGVGVCNSPFHEEWRGQPCACINCRPVGFCVDDPCQNCEGPTSQQCQPPDDDDDANTGYTDAK